MKHIFIGENIEIFEIEIWNLDCVMAGFHKIIKLSVYLYYWMHVFICIYIWNMNHESVI